ncbi:Lcl C-terminal domain-containing protein [Rheinheimera sp.]|uniref:Lcl C-terminal domain-containing protein n=1 Tax=Rheinheimera sp. TaxID=1869214 RepID=UPI0040473578
MRSINAFVFAVSVAGFSCAAYECNESSIEATTKPQNFILDNVKGTVTDLRFGLMWDMCSFGQEYNSELMQCDGDPASVNSWSEAILTQDEMNSSSAKGFDDWRLPNIKELQSIVERQCSQPAIRLSIFKGTANGVYWSNTPDNTVNPEMNGRIIDFSDGLEFFRATSPVRFVRHVRVISN